MPHLIVSPIGRDGKIYNIHWTTQAGPFFLPLLVVDMKLAPSLDVYCDVTNLPKIDSLKQQIFISYRF